VTDWEKINKVEEVNGKLLKILMLTGIIIVCVILLILSG